MVPKLISLLLLTVVALDNSLQRGYFPWSDPQQLPLPSAGPVGRGLADGKQFQSPGGAMALRTFGSDLSGSLDFPVCEAHTLRCR